MAKGFASLAALSCALTLGLPVQAQDFAVTAASASCGVPNTQCVNRGISGEPGKPVTRKGSTKWRGTREAFNGSGISVASADFGLLTLTQLSSTEGKWSKHMDRLSSWESIPNGDTRFEDVIYVRSDTVPKGIPVTITVRVEVVTSMYGTSPIVGQPISAEATGDYFGDFALVAYRGNGQETGRAAESFCTPDTLARFGVVCTSWIPYQGATSYTVDIDVPVGGKLSMRAYTTNYARTKVSNSGSEVRGSAVASYSSGQNVLSLTLAAPTGVVLKARSRHNYSE